MVEMTSFMRNKENDDFLFDSIISSLCTLFKAFQKDSTAKQTQILVALSL